MDIPKKELVDMRRLFRRLLILAVALWTMICLVTVLYLRSDSQRQIEHVAHETARESIEKDMLYRYWAAGLGGIYVPVTERTPANPLLSGVNERDITTPSGRRLTLLHPASLMRQVQDMGKDFTNIQGHFTSLQPLRPENAADPWEEKALRALSSGSKEFGEVIEYRGGPHYRLMFPLIIEEPCMACHAAQGYKLGDLRGGIAAAVPMHLFDAVSRGHHSLLIKQIGGLWVLGLIGISLAASFVHRRIDERDRAEEALQSHLDFTRSIVENEPECVKILGRGGEVRFMNPAGLAMIGADGLDAVLGRPVQELVLPEHREAYLRLNDRVFAGESGALEFEMSGLKGNRLWLETRAVPLRDKSGNVESLLGITRDVTERRTAGLELQRSAARYRQLFDDNPHPMWVYDRESLAFLTVNDAAVRKYGFSQDEFQAMTIAEIRPPEDVPLLRETVKDRREGILKSGPWRHRKRDGTVMDVEITSHTITWEGRAAVLVMSNDITERKRAELELRNALALNQTLIDSLPYPSVLVRYPDRKVLTANRLARESGAEVGKHCYEGFGLEPADRQRQGACASCRADEMFGKGETIVTHERFAKERWWAVYWVPVDPATYLHFIIDITDRKQLEQKLLQAQKIESVGRLAGGIAHDINNMLTPVLGYAEMLEYKMPAGDPRREDLAEIASAAVRIRDMTRQLLAFAREQTLEVSPLDLNAVVSGFSKMLRVTLREDIRISMQLSSTAGSIMGDKSQLEQVIMNLAVNAQDAMSAGGTFTLGTRDVVVNEEYAASRPGLAPGPYVQLIAGDTGTGMDRETMARIFDPFFTTKESGRGTGLGLAMVYGIVKQHGGYIEVRSEPGKGAEFLISLPVSDPSAGTARVASETRGNMTGSETILLVEDQEQVLQMVSRMLSGKGYRVLTALSGREALRAADSFSEKIHLVLSDVIMPDMNGKELIEQLRKVRKNVRVLFMSGYPAEVISSHGVLDGGINFIRKPFGIGELTAKVRQVLDEQDR